MGSPRSRFVVAAAVVIASIGGLIAWALNQSAAYYMTPAEILAAPPDPTERIRVKGTVVPGSIEIDGPTTTFRVVEDGAAVTVTTDHVLPDLFGEEMEVVAEGAFIRSGVFSATTVLTKCPSKFKAKDSALG